MALGGASLKGRVSTYYFNPLEPRFFVHFTTGVGGDLTPFFNFTTRTGAMTPFFAPHFAMRFGRPRARATRASAKHAASVASAFAP